MTGMTCIRARKTEIFPDDVEAQEQGIRRAVNFINQMFDKYNNKTILTVGHGFINRCILSVVYNIPKNEVPKMDNAEYRIIHMNGKITDYDMNHNEKE